MARMLTEEQRGSAQDKCETCRFYDGELASSGTWAKGCCKRFPPGDKWFPQTWPTSWCGEFVKRKAKT